MTIADRPFTIKQFAVSYDGALLFSDLGPGCNPDVVVAAFTMIGMGVEAREWRSYARRAELASDTLSAQSAKIIPEGASLFDVLMAADTPELRTLRDDVATQRKLAADAWRPLGLLIEEVKTELPSFAN